MSAANGTPSLTGAPRTEPQDALVGLLRDDLNRAGFAVDTVRELWGTEADAALTRGHRIPAMRRLSDRTDPLATLASLFILGLPTTRGRASEALPTLGLDGAERLSLIRLQDEQVRPLLDLRPYGFVDEQGAGEFLIASDLGELALGGPIAEDHVLGVGGASATLAAITVPERSERVLDLGTGCGIQALHAARRADRVVATDLSERALAIARLNLNLAGVEAVEFRSGSLFEPVVGERFDRIVSNPPFVITPRRDDVPAYEYRDGGMVGDELVRAVIRGAEAHLTDGGIAQLLANWEYRDGVDGLDRVTEWVADTGLDAWVVEREVQSVEEYTETWIRDGGVRSGDEFDRLSRAWLDDFEERGVDRVGFGYVTLRRPTSGSPTLRRFERFTAPLASAALGETIATSLRAHDRLESLGQRLADARLTVAPDVTEERHYWPGADDPSVMVLRQGGGFGRSHQVGTAVAAVVGACDGDLSVGAIVEAVASITEVDAAALLDEVLPEVRELVFTGFLRLTGSSD